MAFGVAIESMVSILLLLTILYCVRLDKQLRLLKADERSLKATIGELVTATEIAERAIAGLRQAAVECDTKISARFASSQTLSGDLERQISAGDDLLKRLVGIVAGSRIPSQPASPSPQSVVAAASAFAERAKARVEQDQSRAAA